ncbi:MULTISPECIES: Maf-like protein [Flavobacterium]|uniref:dTTP/UTP pyrophosphatase n=1 Tax=Flavobacterium gawalongense TaxID=2594432 RepID=A0A553BIT7_9FLAO|nr:Maf-like protein [Flavobacterium gawalongense]TRX00063.1 septum formation protein Maf [Flavobacterium gawalongense]TRX04844.1 septum formation protein Maf [Flavobacterium gawalongense]TRX08161.1 septum formation protein Maf [Flavobacterium gawalongense]TRX08735.1 septum formation protein Maf [Flavobacterium gawalongense]TRX24663.1 septum formation protein Maf [Flavobacterium gawalongense]
MLRNKLKKYKLILASGSPRRQQFFKDLDLDFEIRLKEIEEVYPPELEAAEITNYLAELKANAFEGELQTNEILITSDTIVWHNNKALGKPKDEQDAFEILKSLSNTTHEVITSVCFKTNEKTALLHEITKVTFNELSDESIRYYLENYKPYDKAGAYGIQEWIGFIGVSKIEGSYANVMGMPTDKVYEYLSKLA